MTAIYLHAPINYKLPFDIYENEMHSIFSTTTGIMFCTFCAAISFIVKTKQQIILSVVVGMIALLLSYSMFIHSDYRGLYQRAIFIIAFGWFLYVFKKYKFLKLSNSWIKLNFLKDSFLKGGWMSYFYEELISIKTLYNER